MPIDQSQLPIYTDFSGFAKLRATAHNDQKAALGKVSQQFEAIFTQMMLKSMRAATASFGSGILDSEQSNSYRDLFDQQLALTLSNRGRGLGIAKVLQRQLSGHPTAAEPAKTASAFPVNGAENVPAKAMPIAPKDIPLLPLTPPSDGVAAPAIPTATASPSATTFPVRDATPVSVFRELARQTTDKLAPYVEGVTHALDQVASTAQAVVAKLPSGPVDFIHHLAPYAEQAAQKLGVSARAILAQAALETGWGKHMPQQANGQTSLNLFGLKTGSSWNGQRSNVNTIEFENGVAVQRQASFRAYDSVAQAFSDYAHLLSSSPRYSATLGHGEDVAGFAHALQSAGYATDPSYAQKLRSIAESPQMREALELLKNSAQPPTT